MRWSRFKDKESSAQTTFPTLPRRANFSDTAFPKSDLKSALRRCVTKADIVTFSKITSPIGWRLGAGKIEPYCCFPSSGNVRASSKHFTV
ncbi:hypothetical protein Zmor_013576 [Zophobas morio]|uniref:Uncharacterized protein n=1 Tax=Zophobas morio TaxID=2755281 RepID=A0AA38IHP5_9CUCU|nr:hypothetical protein Zmor_013576 [Zophobas morio]